MKNEIKPKLRDSDARTISYVLMKAISEAFRTGEFPFQNCITCSHFDKKTELCRLYKARPPAEVIAYGCPSYVDFDIIPF